MSGLSCSLLNFFISIFKSTKAKMEESASAIGIQTKTLSMVWKYLGKKIKSGTKSSSCLVEDRITAMGALPMDWKKLEATIWNPTIGKAMQQILKLVMARLIISGSLVKSLAT